MTIRPRKVSSIVKICAADRYADHPCAVAVRWKAIISALRAVRLHRPFRMNRFWRSTPEDMDVKVQTGADAQALNT